MLEISNKPRGKMITDEEVSGLDLSCQDGFNSYKNDRKRHIACLWPKMLVLPAQ